MAKALTSIALNVSCTVVSLNFFAFVITSRGISLKSSICCDCRLTFVLIVWFGGKGWFKVALSFGLLLDQYGLV